MSRAAKLGLPPVWMAEGLSKPPCFEIWGNFANVDVGQAVTLTKPEDAVTFELGRTWTWKVAAKRSGTVTIVGVDKGLPYARTNWLPGEPQSLP